MKRVTKKEIRNYDATLITNANIYTYENAIACICVHDSSHAPMSEQSKEVVSEIIRGRNFYRADYHTEMYSSGVYGCTGRVDEIEFMNDKWDVIDTLEVKFYG